MTETLDLIKLELLSQYERSGRIDIGEWVKRHPIHRDELIDFWMWLKGTREPEVDAPEPLDRSEIEAYEESLRNTCLAVTFGREWLKPAADPNATQFDTLADELAMLRQRPRQERVQHVAFRKAVVCTWVVARLQQTRPRVTRLAVQKVTYLLDQAMALGIFVEHDRKPLGPYDSKARYRDAEPIARKKGWLQITGTILRASSDLAALSQYVSKYVRSEPVATRFVECLAPLPDDQLETLATTYWIARELESAKNEVTVASVAHALASTKEWKAKLMRRNFTEARLAEALSFLHQLRLVGSR
jgi:hypothetical protein